MTKVLTAIPRVLRIALLLQCGLLLLACSVQAQGEEQPQIAPFQVRSFTEQCARLLEKGRYSDVARLYHYPETMTPAELEAERVQISASLEELGRLFGSFQGVSIPDQPQHLHQFEVQGGSLTYWAERSRYYQLVYKTQFSELGEGGLVFRAIVYDHRLQLRSIGYALSAELPGSEERKAVIDRQMTRFFFNLQSQARE